MTEVVELRIHGVGGSTPEALLGESGPAEVVQVAAEGPSTFHARRRDRRVEGYVWGRLTSTALMQPLWLLLLPFTLVNVAAWMHLPNEDLRVGRRSLWPFKALRLLIVLVGMGLTLSYVFWIANILINKVYGYESFLGVDDPRVKILLGWMLPVLFVVAMFLVARRTQARFEAFPGPVPPGPAPQPKQARTLVARVATSVAQPAIRLVRYSTREEKLSDEWFWARIPGARLRLSAHIALALVALGVLLWWALGRAEDPEGLRLAVFATYTTEALLWVLLAVAVVHLVGWRRPLRGTNFRWIGPQVAATAGVGLASGFFYGLTLWALNDPERVASLGTAFGFAAIAWLVGLLGLGAWVALRAGREYGKATEGRTEYVDPQDQNVKGRELTGATRWMLKHIGLHRAFSDVGRNSDLVLTLAQAAFLVTALVQLRFGRLQGLEAVATLGNWVAAAGAVGVLVFLVRRSFRPDQRRLVGIIWEILTFWPRRFHPLAVRPYAERAVPELQQRLWHHVVDERRRIILSAHSQGTVIAYAALLQLASYPRERSPDVTRDIAFVTYGSPLRQLYAWAFPAYFDPTAFRELQSRLFSGHLRGSPWAWRNFYRLTDYIGKKVFDDGALEEVIPDPARQPALGPLPLDRPVDPAWPDTPRTIWMDLARHSFYNSEPRLKEWIAKLRVELAA